MLAITNDRLSMRAVFAALFLSVVLIVSGSQGVRGTDQYNYLADTRTTLAGEAHLTNLLFPAKLIREGDEPTPAWFHHNGPPIQVAAWMAYPLGGMANAAYSGWILMNLLAHLVVAACVFALARKVADQRIALWMTSLYLVSPSAIWLGINVLQEMFFAGLLAVALTGFIYRSHTAVLLIGSAALLVGVLSHPIFQAAALLLTLYVAVEALLNKRFLKFAVAAIYLGAVFYLLANKGVWFPSSFQPDLTAIITSSIPGESNMFWHYSLEQRSISMQLLVDKLVAGAQRHFLSPVEAPFYIYTNLAVVSLLYLGVRHLTKVWALLLPLSLFLGLYAGMILLQQNQPRYQQIVAIASFVTIAMAWSRSGFRVPDSVLVCVLAGSVLVAGYLSWSAASDASTERAGLATLVNQLDTAGLGDDARVASFDISPHSPLAVSIKPSLLLSIRTDMMGEGDISEALALYRPTHILTKVQIDPDQLATVVDRDVTKQTLIKQTRFGDLRLLTLHK